MSNRIIPVRPGLLISMRTSIRGGVSYRREDLADEIEGEGTRTEWKTEKRVDNADEYTRARRLRGRITTLISGVCVKTRFTYIFPLGSGPQENEQVLNDRVAEAQAACDAFNETATYSHVSFDLMRGRYMEDTRETVQAVRREIHELMDELQAALTEGKVEGIRDVAAKATQMGRLLEADSEARGALERAVRESRRVATQLVKRIEEGAEAVAEVLKGANVSLIATARHTFGEDEMGEITEDAAQGMPAVALGQFGDLDQDYVEPPSAPVVPEFTEDELAAFLVLYERTPAEYFADYSNEPDLEAQVRADLAGFMATTDAEPVAEEVPPPSTGQTEEPTQEQAGDEEAEEVPEDDPPAQAATAALLPEASAVPGGPQPIHQGMSAAEALANIHAYAVQQGLAEVAAAAQEMQASGIFNQPTVLDPHPTAPHAESFDEEDLGEI